MHNWLKCTLSPGHFEGEFGVNGTQHNGTPFALFVPAAAVRLGHEPAVGKMVAGWVRVKVLDRKGELVLVRLPSQTFQSCPFATVTADQLLEPLALGGANGSRPEPHSAVAPSQG
jgi:hypothetical protein